MLDVQNGKALLLSKDILEYRQFNWISYNATWVDSNIRNWLHNDFYTTAFTKAEQAAIVPVAVQGTLFFQVYDRVFLLSS